MGNIHSSNMTVAGILTYRLDGARKQNLADLPAFTVLKQNSLSKLQNVGPPTYLRLPGYLCLDFGESEVYDRMVA